jgi:polar amino acid transport system substrate-binding protein
MRSNRSLRVVATVASAGVLLLSATVVAGASVKSHSTPSASLNAAAAKLVPGVYKAKTLQSAMDASYAPDEFTDANGKVIGFDADLMKALATTLGLNVVNQNVTFDNIIPGIQSGQYDIGNSSFTDTTARQAMVNFVHYFSAGEAYYVKKGTSLAFSAKSPLVSLCSTKSTNRVKVAVEAGTTEESDAQSVVAYTTHPATGKNSCSKTSPFAPVVDSFTTQDQANTALSSGQDTVGFLDSQVAAYVVATATVNGAKLFALAGAPFFAADYGMAFKKDANGLALAKAFAAAFVVIQKSGVYGAILAHWGVTPGALKTFKVD